MWRVLMNHKGKGHLKCISQENWTESTVYSLAYLSPRL